MLWFVPVALATPMHWEHVTLHAAVPFRAKGDTPRRDQLIERVLELAGDGPVTVWDPERREYASLRELTLEELELLHPMAVDRSRTDPHVGLERDLWVDGQVVVVRHGPDGRFEIDRTPTGPFVLPVAPAGQATRMGARRIKGPFTERERALLWAAFERLSPTEQALLRGITYQRRRGRWGKLVFRGSSAAMGSFLPTRPFVIFWSGMYDEHVVNGAPEDPLPKGLWTSVHELGHAIGWGPEYDAARAARAGVSGAWACQQEASAAEPVIAAFLEVAGKGHVTDYSHSNAGEAFADAFALYRLHPDFLGRASPEVLAWFEADGHLAWLDDPRWEACQAPGLAARRRADGAITSP